MPASVLMMQIQMKTLRSGTALRYTLKITTPVRTVESMSSCQRNLSRNPISPFACQGSNARMSMPSTPQIRAATAISSPCFKAKLGKLHVDKENLDCVCVRLSLEAMLFM